MVDILVYEDDRYVRLRVTDLIPDVLSCGGVLLLWSVLSCGV